MSKQGFHSATPLHHGNPARVRAQWLAVAIFAMLMAACGFRLQGTTPLPFETLSITIPENTQFGANVRRAIRASSPQTRIVTAQKDSEGNVNYQAQLQMVSLNEHMREVSLNPQGRVEEYELTLTFVFRLVNSRQEAILPDVTLQVVRDMPFDDSVVQAKEGETRSMFNEMLQSLVERLMRRISAPDVHEAFKELEQQAANEAL